MTQDVARAFDHIASGEASPNEALAAIRAAADRAGKAFGQRVYIALKAVTVRRLTSRRGDDANAWIDVIRQSSSLLKSRGETALGERLLALSDMTADWARTCKTHDLKSVLERPYVAAILEALHRGSGSAKRADLAERLAIGDANFSRILGTLESVGLIMRDRRKVRTISLTEEGARLAAERLGVWQVEPVAQAKIERSVESVLKDVRRLVKEQGHRVATYEPAVHRIHFYGGDVQVDDLNGRFIRCEVHRPADYEQGSYNTGLGASVFYGGFEPGGLVAPSGRIAPRQEGARVVGAPAPPAVKKPRAKTPHRGRD